MTLATAVRSACPSGSRTAPSGSLAADSVQSAPIRPLLKVRPPIVIVSTERDCPSSDICVVSRDLSGISASPLSLKSKEMLRPLLIAKLPVPSMWAVFASLRLLLALCRSSVGEGSASVAAEPHAIARAATELRSRRSTTRRYKRHSAAGPSKCSQRVSARWRRGLVLGVERSADARRVLRSPAGDLGSRLEAELLANPLHVTLGGALGYGEPRRDLFVGQPFCDELRHSELACAERTGPFVCERVCHCLRDCQSSSFGAHRARSLSKSCLEVCEPLTVRQREPWPRPDTGFVAQPLSTPSQKQRAFGIAAQGSEVGEEIERSDEGDDDRTRPAVSLAGRIDRLTQSFLRTGKVAGLERDVGRRLQRVDAHDACGARVTLPCRKTLGDVLLSATRVARTLPDDSASGQGQGERAEVALAQHRDRRVVLAHRARWVVPDRDERRSRKGARLEGLVPELERDRQRLIGDAPGEAVLVCELGQDLQLAEKALDTRRIPGGICIERLAEPVAHDRDVCRRESDVVLSEARQHADGVSGPLADQPREDRPQVGELLHDAAEAWPASHPHRIWDFPRYEIDEVRRAALDRTLFVITRAKPLEGVLADRLEKPVPFALGGGNDE